MKVVKNSCYGGFGLSTKAKLEYAKRKGFDLYFYKQTKHSFDGEDEDEYVKIDPEEADEEFITCEFKEDLGDKINGKELNEGDWFHPRDVDRDDPDLVAVVEELGSDKASGQFANLTVKEIPDDIDWHIDEYDGMETIREAHRTF